MLKLNATEGGRLSPTADWTYRIADLGLIAKEVATSGYRELFRLPFGATASPGETDAGVHTAAGQLQQMISSPKGGSTVDAPGSRL